MKLLVLMGNSAVGKMTVGQELMKLTDLRLFHNHMTIEPAVELFGYYHHELVARMRQACFEEFAASDQYGLIFTFVWAFSEQSDWDYIKGVAELFQNHGAEVYYAELVAPQAVRLERNETENRLQNKASKRNLEWSRNNLLELDGKYRLESLPGEIPFKNYIKIDNSNLSPQEAARRIQQRFQL